MINKAQSIILILMMYLILFQVWPEKTDPQKFVFEDVAIATYLLVGIVCVFFVAIKTYCLVDLLNFGSCIVQFVKNDTECFKKKNLLVHFAPMG